MYIDHHIEIHSVVETPAGSYRAQIGRNIVDLNEAQNQRFWMQPGKHPTPDFDIVQQRLADESTRCKCSCLQKVCALSAALEKTLLVLCIVERVANHRLFEHIVMVQIFRSELNSRVGLGILCVCSHPSREGAGESPPKRRSSHFLCFTS